MRVLCIALVMTLLSALCIEAFSASGMRMPPKGIKFPREFEDNTNVTNKHKGRHRGKHKSNGPADYQTLRYKASTGKYTFSDDASDGVVAVKAQYTHSMKQIGWDVVRINDHGTELTPGSNQIHYAAGYAEGYLTQVSIYQGWFNTIEANLTVGDKLANWVGEHITWMRGQVDANPTSSYWKEVGRVFSHLDGLTAGYQDNAPSDENLGFFDLFMLNFIFEMWDVEMNLGVAEPGKFRKGGCSSLTRVTSDDIILAHNTWSTYETMLRQWKEYDFGGQKFGFTGYPGTLHSGDDFYLLQHSGMTAIETTNDIYDESIFAQVSKTSVSEWIRVTVSNRLATSPTEWANTFCQYNSGTYNNQWMIFDMNSYTPGSNIQPGGFVALEQMPGICEIHDIGYSVNEKGYWSSFNIPFFKRTYDASGAPAMVDQYGPEDGTFFEHNKTVRYRLFEEHAPLVNSIGTMKTAIRWNNYKESQWSKCGVCSPGHTAMFALAPRGDLNPKNGKWGPMKEWIKQRDLVATDGKVTSFKMFQDFKATLISGPTTSNDLPPFVWSTSPFSRYWHYGQPDKFNFDWIDTSKV